MALISVPARRRYAPAPVSYGRCKRFCSNRCNPELRPCNAELAADADVDAEAAAEADVGGRKAGCGTTAGRRPVQIDVDVAAGWWALRAHVLQVAGTPPSP